MEKNIRFKKRERWSSRLKSVDLALDSQYYIILIIFAVSLKVIAVKQINKVSNKQKVTKTFFDCFPYCYRLLNFLFLSLSCYICFPLYFGVHVEKRER